MVAGLNSECRIWRIEVDADDAVGGALITGTVVYDYLPIRLQAVPEEQLLMQQGLQTIRTFTAILQPGTLDIRERDELEIIDPYDDIYYGVRFRITSVTYSSHNQRDPRNFIRLGMIRNIRAHSLQ